MNTSSRYKKLTDVAWFLLANLVVSFFVLLAFFKEAFNSPETFFISLLWSFTISTTQWIGPVMIITFLEKKISWLEFPIRRTIVQVISLLSWSIFAFILVQTVMYYLVLGITPAQLWPGNAGSVLFALGISLFISLVFTAVGFFKSWRKAQIKEAELKTEMMVYKYESLRNQINPHFLFNSLNVLSDLVYTDQKQAVSFIRQLGDLFHYVLDSRDKELVSLHDELRFIDSYGYLLKTRFGDKLRLDIQIGKKPNIQDGTSPDIPTGTYHEVLIVPMTLQLLIENAVKHNEISEKFPLDVKVSINGDYIIVENPKQPKQSGEPSSNTGLRNIKQQYSFFTAKEVIVNETNEQFSVQVPLLFADIK